MKAGERGNVSGGGGGVVFVSSHPVRLLLRREDSIINSMKHQNRNDIHCVSRDNTASTYVLSFINLSIWCSHNAAAFRCTRSGAFSGKWKPNELFNVA